MVIQRGWSQPIDAAPETPVVLVVDDDPEVRDALSSLFRSVGLEPRLFASTAEFLHTSFRKRRAALCSTSGCPEWAASTSKLN